MMFVGDHAGAVVVREEQVVILGDGFL